MDAAATQAAATIVSKLSSLTGKILMAEGNPLFIAKAVSYTHLDVYKRQAHYHQER